MFCDVEFFMLLRVYGFCYFEAFVGEFIVLLI